MSGPTDLARLTVTIDTANELLLSDQIKMMMWVAELCGLLMPRLLQIWRRRWREP